MINMEKIKVGFCITGSFCTFEKALKEMRNLIEKDYDVTAVVSDNAKSLDTRFYKAEDFLEELKKITGKEVIDSIVKAEPIGPKNYFDILVVAPATGNTIAKISRGITDTTVTMAVKSHLRNSKPVVIAISTNDGLGAAAENFGKILTRKNLYFVPFGQDDFIKKPCSLVADMTKLEDTVCFALKGEQIQPLIVQHNT